MSAFEIIPVAGEPQRLAGSQALMIEQHEWLQLTLGRFLAPARGTERGVEYLLLGAAPEDGDETEAVLAGELAAFRDCFQQLAEHLGGQLQSEVASTHALLSLQVLLEVRLPSAQEVEAFHLRGGALQVTGWGLAQGVAVREVLGRMEDGAYFTQLERGLRRKYGLGEGGGPEGSGGGTDYRPAAPESSQLGAVRLPPPLPAEAAPKRKPPAVKKASLAEAEVAPAPIAPATPLTAEVGVARVEAKAEPWGQAAPAVSASLDARAAAPTPRALPLIQRPPAAEEVDSRRLLVHILLAAGAALLVGLLFGALAGRRWAMQGQDAPGFRLGWAGELGRG